MTKHCRKSSHSRTNKNLWIIWRKIIEVVYADYAVAKRKYCTWLSFRNCISCVYNCDDLPSNNSSLRGSHKWFSYIHNLKIFELFRSRRHFGVNYRTVNPASLAATKSFTFQQGKATFSNILAWGRSLVLPTDSLFQKAWWMKGPGEEVKGSPSRTPTKASFEQIFWQTICVLFVQIVNGSKSNNFTCKLCAWVIFIILVSYWITV